MGKRKSAELGRAKASWLCSPGVDVESSELASEGESGFPIAGRVWFDSGLAEDKIASGSPIVSFVAGSPAGFKLPSPDPTVCSGFKAGVVIVAANPLKIKSPWILVT